MGKPGNTGIKRIIRAAGFSMQGLKAAWKHESAFRQEVTLAVILTPLALYLGHDAIERSLLIGSVFIVIITELVNSAIEAVVDRIGDEPHKLSGRAKDIGSAAVFMALVMVVIIWGLVIYERYFQSL